jgi:hypothetical protein
MSPYSFMTSKGITSFSRSSSLVDVFGSTNSTGNADTLMATSKSIISLIVTHRYTTLQATEETWPTLNRPTLKHVTFFFYENIRRRNIIWGHNILTEVVPVTQMSNNARISVWQTVDYDKLLFPERYSYKCCVTYHMVYESLPYLLTVVFGLIPQPISHACLNELAERSIHVVVVFVKQTCRMQISFNLRVLIN